MTGIKESSRLPTTRRVRNFDPSPPRRRSAKSLIKLRARTKVRVTNRRKTTAERATRNTICWLFAGLMNGKSKDVCANNSPNNTTMTAVKTMASLFRLGRRGIGLPEAIGQELCRRRKRITEFNYKPGLTGFWGRRDRSGHCSHRGTDFMQ